MWRRQRNHLEDIGEEPVKCNIYLLSSPSEQLINKLQGLLLARLALEAGFPPGIVNVISGAGPTGELLSSHMKIRYACACGILHVLMEPAEKSASQDRSELGEQSCKLLPDRI